MFQDALAVKISLYLLKGLWSYGDFKLTGSDCPQIFSAPTGETMPQTLKSFRSARTCLRSSTTMPSLELATPLNAEVQKMAKVGFFANRGRENKPIETKFGT